MLVKDERDVIEQVLRHLACHVDEIYVSDNGSTDGTREILDTIVLRCPFSAYDDDEIGYFQSRKTTALARIALEHGHEWVVPCDADEVWYVPSEFDRVADLLAALPPSIQFVKAELYDHKPSSLDPPADDVVGLEGAENRDAVLAAFRLTPEPNPLKRIGHRKTAPAPLHKVACRLSPSLVIAAGNHACTNDAWPHHASGLVIRHYPWRTADQYVRKIRNGERAYAATDLPADVGEHWRQWAGKPDDAIREWFSTWAWVDDPSSDVDALIYDPVTPLLRGQI